MNFQWVEMSSGNDKLKLSFESKAFMHHSHICAPFQECSLDGIKGDGYHEHISKLGINEICGIK